MDKSLFNKIAVLQSKLKSTKENIEALENSDTGQDSYAILLRTNETEATLLLKFYKNRLRDLETDIGKL
jgi:hypothetical protein